MFLDRSRRSFPDGRQTADHGFAVVGGRVVVPVNRNFVRELGGLRTYYNRVGLGLPGEGCELRDCETYFLCAVEYYKVATVFLRSLAVCIVDAGFCLHVCRDIESLGVELTTV